MQRLPEEAVLGPARDLWGSTDPLEVAYWRPRQKAFRETVTWSPTVDPEWLKIVSLDLLEEAGAHLLLHCWAAQAIVSDGAVRGIVFESKQGRRAVLAKVVIDATGDLDVCALAGARYESDIDSGDVSHCMNVVWCWAGVDMDRWLAYATDSPEAHRALMRHAAAELGHAELPMVSWRNDVCVFMGPRLAGYSGLDVDDLTAVEVESRRRMVAHLEFFRAHCPGFEHAWLMTTASQTGIRHTRRLSGVRKLTSADWKAGARFDDEIGISPSPSQKFASVSVPYGSLLPEELDGVLAAGRHISCDPSTQSFMREIPQCWLTGQAAGIAAALATAAERSPREVEIRDLQAELRRQSVYLQAGVPV
jgi:FAD-dependent oxidoreductase family protein